MKLNLISSTALALVVSSTAAMAADCIQMGGVAVPNFYGEGDDKPMIISAVLTGTVQNAAGKITATRVTETGLEMDMEHYFGRSDGGGFLTNDLGILTEVPEKPGRYMIEITYDIQPDVTRGTLKGYTGQFNSFGLVDLRDNDNLIGLVRYTGEICR
jgi:hypothetical protein